MSTQSSSSSKNTPSTTPSSTPGSTPRSYPNYFYGSSPTQQFASWGPYHSPNEDSSPNFIPTYSTQPHTPRPHLQQRLFPPQAFSSQSISPSQSQYGFHPQYETPIAYSPPPYGWASRPPPFYNNQESVVGSEAESEEDVTEIPQQGPIPSQRRKGKRHATESELLAPTRRKTNYSLKDDEIITNAWIKISEDNITGAEQTMGKFWERIATRFNAETQTVRNAKSLQSRWNLLQGAYTKFSAILKTVRRVNPSGKTEDDKMELAKDDYKTQTNQEFKWGDHYKIISSSPRWKQVLANMEHKERIDGAQLPIPIPVVVGDDGDQIPTVNERGVGRKAEKERRKAAQENKEAVQATSDSLRDYMKEVGARSNKRAEDEDRKLILLKQMADSSKVKAQAKADKMKLKMLKYNQEIMDMDIDALPPNKKAYYMGLQARIMREMSDEAGN